MEEESEEEEEDEGVYVAEYDDGYYDELVDYGDDEDDGKSLIALCTNVSALSI